MDTRELLTQLEKLEHGLDSFSFTELKTSEASKLKSSFESFKNGLEEKVFGVPTTIEFKEEEQQKVSGPEASDSRLIANVSHEIRTPLNGILGFLDLLQETTLTPEQEKLVNAIGAASNNLMGLINELLDFSKIAAGQEKFEKVLFNPSNLVDEVTFLCKTLINDKNVALMVNYDEGIPASLIGDPAKLSQVLLNLTGNAVKFVENGEIRLDVTLKEENSKKVFLEFVVSDTGIGIPNEKLKHIFESYRQVEPSTRLKYGGSGLGLSIVKEIIEKQHGCIAVSSTLGRGTTFKVVLPFDKAKQTKGQPTTREVSQNQLDISGKSILVLEDDPLTQKLMENRLRQWGCKPYITDNGFYALQLLKEHAIDLLLLDIRLPEMDGNEIVKEIRKKTSGKNLPVIALSADAEYLRRIDLAALGINDFIIKPYDSNELKEKIHKNCNRIKLHGMNSMEFRETKRTESTVVSLEPIAKECLGKVELLEELVRLFEQNILEFIGKTKMHLQSRNLQGVGFSAHKIKSSLKMLHANTLIAICEEMMFECRNANNVKHLETLFEKFLGEYPKVEMGIKLEMKRITS